MSSSKKTDLLDKYSDMEEALKAMLKRQDNETAQIVRNYRSNFDEHRLRFHEQTHYLEDWKKIEPFFREFERKTKPLDAQLTIDLTSMRQRHAEELRNLQRKYRKVGRLFIVHNALKRKKP